MIVKNFYIKFCFHRCWGWVVSSKQPAESESISNELPVEVVEVVRPEGVQLRLQVGRGVVGAVVVRHGRERLLLQGGGGGEAARDGWVPTLSDIRNLFDVDAQHSIFCISIVSLMVTRPLTRGFSPPA